MRTTIDYGIDLGTTNSAIAVLDGVDTNIIKNGDDQDITPSAVSFGKNGQLFVGVRAKNNIVDKPEDAYGEFKRRMGTEHNYQFRASGLVKKPEELSSEILKQLKADAVSRFEEDIQSAVITVPAAFELHQCSATRKAAELAGFHASPLLQEPVAAALAYGFQIDTEKAYWLVYDFGGGTFDAALIKADEGLINVVHHGGDNFLGGSDIDWAIVEKIILPKLVEGYDLPEFKRGNAKWKNAIAKLKRSVEMAKIDLTTKNSTNLTGCVFEDDSGETVDCEDFILTQSDIVAVAQPIIARSIDICKKVLTDKNLSESAVQKIILVGGPTKAPYFRDILREHIGIALDTSMDPLTVVARGAAVFAGTQKIDSKLQKKAAVGEFQIELPKALKTVGHETDPMVGGKVISPEGHAVSGFTLEMVNEKTKWRSGKIPLREDGTFLLNLLAEKGERNTFSIELLNTAGTRQITVPDHIIYTVGAVVQEQPLINSIGVALANNEVEWFFKKGDALGGKKRAPNTFRTVKAIEVGEAGKAISVPVVEGENDAADRNRHIGDLTVTSSDVRRDIPIGSEVEITLKVTESRDIVVNAFFPALDEEFDKILSLYHPKNPNLVSEVELEMRRLDELLEQADKAEQPHVIRRLKEIQQSPLVDDIQTCARAAKGDPDAAEKGDKRLLELKILLDELEAELKAPEKANEIRGWLDDLDRLVKQHGNPEQVEQAEELAEDVESLISQNQHERLPRQQKKVEKLYYDLLFSLPGFWVGQLQRLEKESAKMSDPDEAQRLLDMGRKYLSENKLDGLRNVVGRLWQLLPKSVVEEVQKRGLDAGITR